MIDIYGSHFEFDGESSRKYDLVFANVGTERYRKLSGDIQGVTVFNKKLRQRYLIGDNLLNSPVSMEIDIITKSGITLNKYEQQYIERWLFTRGEYKKLYLDTVDDTMAETYELVNGKTKKFYIFCRFINPERLEYNGGVIGYRATFESSTGYWLQDISAVEYGIDNPTSSSSSQIQLFTDSDIDDYIYPRIIMQIGSVGGDIAIRNLDEYTDQHRDVPTGITNTIPNTTIVMNSATNYITPSYLTKFRYPHFPRLVRGGNNIILKGNISSIMFEFANMRVF